MLSHPFGVKTAPSESGLAQQQIDDPATADMWPIASAVVQNVLVVATRVHQGIRQHRKAVKGTLLGDAFCEREDGGREPRRIGEYKSRKLNDQIR